MKEPDEPSHPLSGAPEPDGTVRRRVTVENRRGLHARAAAKFVKLAGTFDAEIQLTRNELTVSGLSIMGIMMLAAGPGSRIELTATGTQAARAIDALAELMERKFDED